MRRVAITGMALFLAIGMFNTAVAAPIAIAKQTPFSEDAGI